MATITPLVGGQILVQVGNGASPEVFSHPALINTSRGFTITNATESDEIPDATDPLAVATTIRRTRASDTKIDGAGLVDTASVAEYMAWAASGEARNCKVQIGSTTVTAKYILTSFQVSGERVKASECQLTLEQASKPTFTVGG